MILLVDIGNSRLKWRLQAPTGIHARGGDETHGNLDSLFGLRWTALPKPRRVLVSNVSGNSAADRLTRWVAETWNVGVEVAFVSTEACGVQNGYDDPGQLGVDRWLALIAAWSRYHAAACVADCGTAATIDGLSAEGRHTGGLILPGISLMQCCLAANAAALEQPRGGQITSMARNTRDAIWSGGAYAVAACIDRVAAELEEAFGTCQGVITGGHAALVQPQLRHRFDCVPDLVLDGLALWGEAHR